MGRNPMGYRIGSDGYVSYGELNMANGENLGSNGSLRLYKWENMGSIWGETRIIWLLAGGE